MLDLTKRSANMTKVRQGYLLDDLEYSIQTDSQIEEKDLAVIEREVNKKKRKKHKEAKKGGMLSPGSCRNSTLVQREEQRNVQAENQQEAEGNMRDQLMNDRMINMEQDDVINMAPRRELSFCCGFYRRRQNGHMDIACVKDLSQDFVYMLLFVTLITICLTLYAAYV